MKRLTSLFAILFCFHFASAQEFSVTDAAHVSGTREFFDGQHSSVEDLLNDNSTGGFEKFSSRMSDPWEKLTLINSSSQTQTLCFDPGPNSDSVRLYWKTPAGIQQRLWGTLVEQKNKAYPYIRFTLSPHDTLRAILHRTPAGSITFRISGEKALLQRATRSRILYGIFYGVLLALIFYSLAVYLVIRENIYLYFITLLPSILLYYINVNGIGPHYFWGNGPLHVLNKYGSDLIFFPLAITSGFTLCLKFLGTEKHFPKLHRLLSILILVQCGALISLFFGGEIFIRALHLLALFTFLVILVASIRLGRKGIPQGRQLCLVLIIPVIAVLVRLAAGMSWLPLNIVTANVVQLGIMCAALAFSVIIATSLSQINREKRLAEKNALQRAQEMEQLTKEQHTILAQKVEERTEALEKMQDELVQQEKLASIGKLATLLATEIRSPISALSDFSVRSEKLLAELENAKDPAEREKRIAELKELLSQINREGKNADGILKKTFTWLREGKGGHELFGE